MTPPNAKPGCTLPTLLSLMKRCLQSELMTWSPPPLEVSAKSPFVMRPRAVSESYTCVLSSPLIHIMLSADPTTTVSFPNLIAMPTARVFDGLLPHGHWKFCTSK